LRLAGEHAEALTETLVKDLHLSTAEVDAFWSFVTSSMVRLAESHWTAKRSLYWVMDIAFREDESRVRKDHGPQNLAVLRQITLNLVKRNPKKASIRSKRLMAGWREDFLLQVLFG
jgi:predicted transposase YbfD/YdcC